MDDKDIVAFTVAYVVLASDRKKCSICQSEIDDDEICCSECGDEDEADETCCSECGDEDEEE